ncbi:MAG: hypothetical protein EXS55_00900 [Candidatus Magasanikbacteria bacterium]|nr:hypothetical protein [Candidatus Magasanikbacteria bacterium]
MLWAKEGRLGLVANGELPDAQELLKAVHPDDNASRNFRRFEMTAALTSRLYIYTKGVEATTTVDVSDMPGFKLRFNDRYKLQVEAMTGNGNYMVRP